MLQVVVGDSGNRESTYLATKTKASNLLSSVHRTRSAPGASKPVQFEKQRLAPCSHPSTATTHAAALCTSAHLPHRANPGRLYPVPAASEGKAVSLEG